MALFFIAALAISPVHSALAATKHHSKAKSHAVASHHTTVHKAEARRKSTSAKPRLRNAKYAKSSTSTHRRRRRRRFRRHRVILPKAPSAERTDQIQSALERAGYYSGNPSGRWDSATADALRRFQAAHDLPPTGKLDALSLQRLGLGSDIAGVSAPRSVAPAGTSSNPQGPATAKVPSEI